MFREGATMTRAWLLVALGLLLSPGAGDAQSLDVAKLLVGRWEGSAVLKRDSPPRALVVKSVQEDGGRWTARGAFGDPGGNLHGVDIAIETTDGQITLKFTNPGRRPGPVELTLAKDGKHMSGTIWRHAGRVRGESDPLRLQKVD
jgi:hypothetical protein